MIPLLLTVLIASASCVVIPPSSSLQGCSRSQQRPSFYGPCLLPNQQLHRQIPSTRVAASYQNEDFNTRWSTFSKKLKSDRDAITMNEVATLLNSFSLGHYRTKKSDRQLASRFARLMDVSRELGLFSGRSERLNEFYVTRNMDDVVEILNEELASGRHPQMYLKVAMLLRAWRFYFPDQVGFLDSFYGVTFYGLLSSNDIETAVLFVSRHLTHVRDDIKNSTSIIDDAADAHSLLNSDYDLLNRCLEATYRELTVLDLSNQKDKLVKFFNLLKKKGFLLVRSRHGKYAYEWRVKALQQFNLDRIPVKSIPRRKNKEDSEEEWFLTDTIQKLADQPK